MPVVEIEIGDDGAIGKLPEPVQKFFDKKYDEAYRKGADKTERALSPLTVDPVEMERLRLRDKQLSDVELREAERQKEYEKAAKLRDEAAQKEREAAIKAERLKTDAAVDRLRQSLGRTIRAAALAQGARAESLDELERLLGAEVDLDGDLNDFVKDASDPTKPRLTDKGEKVTIEGLVADYLRTHPHHVAAPPVKGGKAPGGATLSGRPPVLSGDPRADARAAVADAPTNRNIANLLRVAVTRAS